MKAEKKASGRRRRPLYQLLLRQLFWRTLLLLTVAAAVVIALRLIGYGRIGDGIVRLFQWLFAVDYSTALTMYDIGIRQNIPYLMIGFAVLFFLLLFRLLLSWFAKYFDEIENGLDQLTDEAHKPIRLSPELSFMADKLNSIKNELDRSAQSVREAEMRKNELVVYLAHDIKTPLTSVIGYLNLLDETPDMPIEQRARYVHITLEKAYRLESLINEFFEITRYTLQNVPLHRQTTDLGLMIAQLAEEAYPRLRDEHKTVETHIPGNMTVYADADKLARVFNNLLKNAVAYSPQNSRIDIYASEQDGEAVIRFENDGELPADRLGHIFEKFYRLDDARQSSTGGAGLGLAIARDIVKLHGGTIYAESRSGRTAFVVRLPHTEDAGDALASPR